ncbi:MAG TPA: hypothetical protein VKN99_12465 [Polyangia bacterium]|nr:hypothetical protein [Polyangia bacterium]
MSAFALWLQILAALGPPDPGARVRVRLDAARQLYDAQEYVAAIETLKPILKDAVATQAQKAQALEYLGLSYLILGNRRKARDAFEDLLSIDQNYTLRDPSQSPKLRAFFEEVKTAFVPGYKPALPATMEHAAPVGAVAGRPVEFAARVTEGAPRVADVTINWRPRGLLQYHKEGLGGADARYRGFVRPPQESVGYVLEYFLEAHDTVGRVIARIGTPEEPLAMEVAGAPLPPPPWYKRWWFWSALGGAVAVGTVAGIMAGTARHAQPGSLGSITLDLHF